MNLTYQILTGRSEEHLIFSEHLQTKLLREIEGDFFKLVSEAKNEGFDITVASSFRSFERQLNIFNAKARGERPLLGLRGEVLNAHDLNDSEKLFAILRWSALPGASRHHWGTDFDLYDKNAISENYHLQLIPEEFEGNGPFAPFHTWLDEQMKNSAFPFFRPYAKDQGGVSPERWHLSHRHSLYFFKAYTFDVFKRNIEESPLEIKELICEKASEIFTNFVQNVYQPPWP